MTVVSVVAVLTVATVVTVVTVVTLQSVVTVAVVARENYCSFSLFSSTLWSVSLGLFPLAGKTHPSNSSDCLPLSLSS